MRWGRGIPGSTRNRPTLPGGATKSNRYGQERPASSARAQNCRPDKEGVPGIRSACLKRSDGRAKSETERGLSEARAIDGREAGSDGEALRGNELTQPVKAPTTAEGVTLDDGEAEEPWR